MCGIAGIIAAEVPVDSRDGAIRRMCAAMHHRGPDDHGIATRDEATLGACRLAIFDPANGHQPMISPDGRWTIVFNGAVYNFQSLRSELAAGGWTFRTGCDTEVLLAAFARWGADCLPRLRGMFAFAVWDAQEHALFLARDAFGIKPLYYRPENGQLLFASEIGALLASGRLSPEIDPVAVVEYLGWFSVPAPRTIYRGIRSLRPGEYATWKAGQFEVRSGWSFHSIPRATVCRSHDEFVGELRARLKDTIRAHLLADVPVGAFLSGGLDSAVVVGLMTRVSGSPLRTFSIGFDEPAYSEAAAAEATARHFGAAHHTHVLTGADVARDLDRLLAAFDQPTGDGVNTYYASEAARAGGVTVALSGLGGDELFGGYPAFKDTPRLARLVPWWRRVPPPARRALVERLRAGNTQRRKLADVLACATSIHEVGALQRRVFSDPGRRELLSDEVVRATGAPPPFHPELEFLQSELAGATPFEIVSAWEMRTYMADVLLRDSDVMSMRHSLELRVPFVDRPLIEWLWRQPEKSRQRGPKSALFEAARDLIPAGMAGRRKRGFTLPFAAWMKRDLRPFLEETFADTSIDRSGLFARRGVQDLWRGFLQRDDSREWSRVWSLAILIAFVNRGAPAGSARPAGPRDSIEVAPAPAGGNPPADPGRRRVAPPRSAAGNGGGSVRARTLLLAPEIYAAEGGIPRILQLYLKALCDLAGTDRRVRLLALNDRSNDGRDERRRLNGPLEISRPCGRSKARFVREALTLARGCDTIVCGHVRQLPVAWLARQFNRSVSYYLIAHGIEVWRPFSAPERTALRGATRILCVSDFTRRELLNHCPLPDDRVVVLPNALDPVFPLSAGRPLRECPPTILTVSRLTFADRYKGVQHLIEAMPGIRRVIPEARLRVIGRGDDMVRLMQIARAASAESAVDFSGYVDDAGLIEAMQTCRLFALPSRKEGFGLVFLEAMANGRPCLGARAGGIPEVVTEDSGVLVEYGDVEAIARAAAGALQREWDQARILARAQEFSFATFKERLASLLAA